MKRWHALLLILPILVSVGGALSAQRGRIATLEEKFLAPCCYSEPISRHRSDVALQMRAEIARWVVEGKSDREITDTYKERYGTRVLVEPEGAQWWWMHVIPWVMLLLGLGFTAWLIRRLAVRRSLPQAAGAAAAALPPDETWDS